MSCHHHIDVILTSYQCHICLRWIHDYQEACVDKLEHFLKSHGQQHLQAFPPTTDPAMIARTKSPPVNENVINGYTTS